MTVSELDFPIRTRGRATVPVELIPLRPLGKADLALLASGRGVVPPPLKEIRDRHHALARCLASGMRDYEASAATGFSPSRISILKGDPSFANLLRGYQQHEGNLLAEYSERMTNLELSAVNRLQEILENEDEAPSATTTLEIAKFASDRNGHAPVSKSVSLSATVGLGDRLAKARQRIRAMAQEVDLIEGEYSEK